MQTLDVQDKPGWFERTTNIAHLVKYAVIGLGAVAIDAGLFLLLDARGMSPLPAQIISVSTAVVFSFVMNARYNFGTRDKVAKRFASFAVVNLIGFFVGLAIILGLTEADVVSAAVAKLVSIPVVTGMQYVLNANWTFLEND